MDEDLNLVPQIADLKRSKIFLRDLPNVKDDSVLEHTLHRLQREVEQPKEAVSGFSSAI